jgi:hypothetical protein
MKTFRCHSGYDRIDLKRDDDGEFHKIYVHRAVALAWHENPNELDYVDHIDRDKLNNNADNLRWCTAADNALNRSFNNNIMPRYISRRTFKLKNGLTDYWVITIMNSKMNYRKRFLLADNHLADIIAFRNVLMTENNIPITD